MKSACLAGIVLLALFGAGCTLFQGTFSIDQAVARLLPNDPQGVSNPNHFIGELEIQRATQLWIQSVPVPLTGGQRITEPVMKQLILLWERRVPIP